MNKKNKNFLLLLALLVCFAMGAYFFGGNENMVYEPAEEKTNTEKNTDMKEKDMKTDAEESATALVSAEPGTSADFFSDFRLAREKRRDAAVELYQATIADGSREEAARTEAEEALAKLYRTSAAEDQVEQILKGRNYQDVIFVLAEDMPLLILKQSAVAEEEKTSLRNFIAAYLGIEANAISVFTVD